MKKFLFGLMVAACLVGCKTSTIEGYDQDKIVDMMFGTNFVSSAGMKLNYRVAVPMTYEKVPLIIMLHGIGNRGDDNLGQLNKQTVGCVLQYMVEEEENAILLAPQCPVTHEWDYPEVLQALYELIEYYKTSEIVDTNRVYLTGFSMGGYGTWKLGMYHPEVFAVLAPVCGGPLSSRPYVDPTVPDGMIGVNIWAVNYLDDPAVYPTYSKKVIGHLWEKDSMCAHMLEMLSGGHTAQIYSEREFLDKIFGSRKLTILYQK